jgi:hypothetical protein
MVSFDYTSTKPTTLYLLGGEQSITKPDTADIDSLYTVNLLTDDGPLII